VTWYIGPSGTVSWWHSSIPTLWYFSKCCLSDGWWHDRSLFLDDQSPFLSPQEDHHRRHFRDRIRYSSYVSISDRRVRRLFRNQQEVESHDGVRLKKHRCGPQSTRMVSIICLYLSQVDHSVCGIDTFESVEEGNVPPRQVSFSSLFPIREWAAAGPD